MFEQYFRFAQNTGKIWSFLKLHLIQMRNGATGGLGPSAQVNKKYFLRENKIYLFKYRVEVVLDLELEHVKLLLITLVTKKMGTKRVSVINKTVS